MPLRQCLHQGIAHAPQGLWCNTGCEACGRQLSQSLITIKNNQNHYKTIEKAIQNLMIHDVFFSNNPLQTALAKRPVAVLCHRPSYGMQRSCHVWHVG